ncbi:MAG TPA: hypothetical protein VF666_16090 [Pyrinomonadaceae bacterium]|jgi:hypothetical protein
MKKSERKLLGETLDKALEPPPQRRRPPALASALSEYDDGEDPPARAKTENAKVAPPHPTSHGVTPPNPTRPIAPERDFNKRANSLDRLALPVGLFPGSSQKLYNALYIRTRGHITPLSSIRATKRELSDWSGIRNAKTIDAHLRYLSAIGLIVSHWERGQNDGALYEVRLPEETTGISIARERSGGVTPPDSTSPQILGGGSPQNLGSPHPTQVPENATTYGLPKTYIKTYEKTDDDEAFAGLLALLKNATKEITGREASASDNERWREVGEVLVTELKVAAARTQVSSAPAFLAEHLRRRLWKKNGKQIESEIEEARKDHAVNTEAKPTPASLSPDEIQEQVNLIAQSMREGNPIETLDEQFSANFRPVQWHTIRSMALVQANVQGKKE